MNRRALFKLIPALACTRLVQAPRLQIGELDPDARYMVVVTPDADAPADDWRWRQQIAEEIRDCFQAAGFERGDVGILILHGYDVAIQEIK